MSQITLNIVAISIFTVTMTTLLGPLIHLSPLVPALAVVVLMGLVSVDRLAWQGTGGILVVDWFARRSPAHRDRVIHHEAGHFLVAYLLNIPVTGYALSAWDALRQGQAGQGGVTFDCEELEAELQQGTLSVQLLERYSTVWMAGGVAETLVYGDAEGGADDLRKFRTIWTQLRRPNREGQEKERWAVLKARNLLQQHQEAYTALVEALKQEMNVAECCKIIEQRLPFPTREGTGD
uniref:ATP-dependent Zn protease n=1 Tax=Trichocoleus desertorum TaxID=1481672 RepID=UPI0025B3F46B|nr:ATP-dependent Zn protease [Trichocoleus desertorum]